MVYLLPRNLLKFWINFYGCIWMFSCCTSLFSGLASIVLGCILILIVLDTQCLLLMISISFGIGLLCDAYWLVPCPIYFHSPKVIVTLQQDWDTTIGSSHNSLFKHVTVPFLLQLMSFKFHGMVCQFNVELHCQWLKPHLYSHSQ